MERTTIRVPVETRALLKLILRWSSSENVGRLVGDMAVNEAARLCKEKRERMSDGARASIYAAMTDVSALERGRITKERLG